MYTPQKGVSTFMSGGTSKLKTPAERIGTYYEKGKKTGLIRTVSAKEQWKRH